jgi:hypothetical protein
MLSSVDVQACSWIEDCDVPGCAGKCILNRKTIDNSDVLEDRQFGEGSWQMCPELAFLVNYTRPGDIRTFNTSRKLQQVSLLPVLSHLLVDLCEYHLNKVSLIVDYPQVTAALCHIA